MIGYQMKKIVMFLLAAGTALNIQAQNQYEGIVFMENEPWTTVLARAAEQDRLIFMDCYTTWCGPCKGLSENVFPQKEVGDFFNANFVNAKYDMEKGDGKMLYEKYREHIPGFPSLLLIDSEGNVVHKMAGYMEPDKLIAGMRAGLEGNSLFALQKKYEAGARDLATVTAYLNALDATAVMNEEKAAVIDELIAGLADLKELEKPEIWSLVGSSVRDPYSEVFRYVVRNIDRGFATRAKADRYALESQLGNAISSEMRMIMQTQQSSEDPDTLAMMRQKSDYLRALMADNNVRRFPDYTAKLMLNDMMLDGRTEELITALPIIRATGLLRYETYFLADCYDHIIINSSDRGVIGAALTELVELQGPPKEKVSGFATNLYDKIVRGYDKLGMETEKAAALAEYEKLEAASEAYRQEFMKALSGDKGE